MNTYRQPIKFGSAIVGYRLTSRGFGIEADQPLGIEWLCHLCQANIKHVHLDPVTHTMPKLCKGLGKEKPNEHMESF